MHLRPGLLAAVFLANALFAPVVDAAEAQVRGTVFEDANGNGTREAGEHGIAGVALSNGRDIVRSAADGSYAVAARPDDLVFAIKPAGRRFGLRANGLPDFWRDGHVPRFDVALSPRHDRSGPMQVLLFTDPQVKSLVDVDYYRRDIVEPLHGTHATIGLSLGDIVNDDVSLYPALNAVTASLGVPWLHIAGNHDLDAGAASDADTLRTFRATYGPDTVAWEESQAIFIGLDDVVAMPGQRPAYVGGLREDQFAFLERYLPTVPKDRLVVLGLHIPLFDHAFRAEDRARLFALLEKVEHPLVLSGHTHNQNQVFWNAAQGWNGARPLHEYNVGAACGAFWSGVKDAQGIPDTTMSDGTPNGYGLLNVQPQGRYSVEYRAARAPEDEQIALHAPRVLRRGAYPAWGVYANVYMGHDGVPVEFRVDGGDWQAMKRVEQPDPRLLAENVADVQAARLRGYDRSPEATPSSHLWRAALPTKLEVGEHSVEVRATLDGREYRSRTTYHLQDARP
jgi:hypothetical protein